MNRTPPITTGIMIYRLLGSSNGDWVSEQLMNQAMPPQKTPQNRPTPKTARIDSILCIILLPAREIARTMPYEDEFLIHRIVT